MYYEGGNREWFTLRVLCQPVAAVHHHSASLHFVWVEFSIRTLLHPGRNNYTRTFGMFCAYLKIVSFVSGVDCVMQNINRNL